MTSPNITPAQARALSTALLTGHVFIASGPDGRVDPQREGQQRTLEIMANGPGWLEWVPPQLNPTLTPGYYVLTESGRAIALTLPDRESSASRQHYVDTGRYLRYGDRPDFQRPQAHEVARLVEVGDFVSGRVVATRPGEVDLQVERGLYRPGTVVTVKVKR